MTILQFAIGLLLGTSVVPLSCWLLFVYPYSEVSLCGLWWGLAVGLPLGLVAVVALLVASSTY